MSFADGYIIFCGVALAIVGIWIFARTPGMYDSFAKSEKASMLEAERRALEREGKRPYGKDHADL